MPAVSKKQQQYMAIRGHKGLSKEVAEEFAQIKRKGLPEKKQ